MRRSPPEPVVVGSSISEEANGMSDTPQQRPSQTGNPNLDRFLSTVGSEENAQAHAEDTRAVYV